ncbi:MAG TPA: hypothetical protein VHC86_11195 [Opitutaceae bacterium]|nr:hypothetical protein [Opitutaceae bacterium]
MKATSFLPHALAVAAAVLGGSPLLRAQAAAPANVPAPPPSARPRFDAKGRPLSDSHGNALRYNPVSGHISNYDQDKVGRYVLPPLLVLNDGEPVTTAEAWYKLRRPEILELYRQFIYGHVPATAPKVTFQVASADPGALGGTAVRKEVVGTFGEGPDAPKMHIVMYLPAHASGPVPVLLHLVFFGTNLAPPPDAPAPAAEGRAARRPRLVEAGPVADILARGWGYAMVRYTEIEPDNKLGAMPQRLNLPGLPPQPVPTKPPVGVRTLALAPGQTEVAPNEWGTISAWAWGASRVLDYFETDPAVDAKRVALIGHSRLGKTVLWAGAQDPRFAVILSSCAGEMGSSLARRDYGETVDDMATGFPWQFAGNFQAFIGHWTAMPTDTHMVIALNAPHGVYIDGGVGDQWSDPVGEFLGEVAAGPVYRLVGRKDLGTDQLPAVDHPLIEGDLGFQYHKEAHVIAASDWQAFLQFAERYLKPSS